MFDGPKLKRAFSGSGGKAPKPDQPPGLLDPFKAAVVNFRGPAICEKLNESLKALTDQHTVKGVAKDVRTHFALQAIATRVNGLREVLQEGGAAGYEKLQEAAQYATRLRKLGLDA